MALRLLKKIKKIADIVRFKSNHQFASKIKIKENIPLNPQEFDLIDDLCDIMNVVKAQRKDYIGQNNIDPEIGLSNGLVWGTNNDNWGGSWQALREKKHEDINIFRLHGNVFSDRATVVYESDELMPEPGEWDYRYLDMIEHMPSKWHVKLPSRFGEIGWNCNGYPVNWTTTTHQERFNLLYASGVCHMLEGRIKEGKNVRYMEVGGGSGEIGYTLASALGKRISLYSVDLPECLIHSTIYHATLLKNKKHYIYTGNLKLPDNINKSLVITDPRAASRLENAIISVPNFLIRDFENELEIDLAFNTWSFSEMSAKQAKDYGLFLRKALGNNGVLFEQNIDLKHIQGANYCKDVFKDIFSYRYSRLNHSINNKLWQESRMYGGEVDIWANSNIGKILTPPSNRKAILGSLWRKCARPWAFNAASHLRGLFDSMIEDAKRA